MDDRARLLRVIAAEMQDRIRARIAGVPTSALEGTALDQAGLRDGAAIVDEYVRAGELGVAFEHLRYMIDETGLAPVAERAQSLREIATALGLRPPRVLGT